MVNMGYRGSIIIFVFRSQKVKLKSFVSSEIVNEHSESRFHLKVHW